MVLYAESHGDGFPVVCLPWFSTDRTVAATAMEPAFAERSGWHRVYVDLPGCGQSPPGPETSDGVLAIVEEFVDHTFGTNPFLLAGFSYGGYIAAGLARRRPAQVAGLLLTCSGPKIRLEDRTLPPPVDQPEEKGWLAGVPTNLRALFSASIGCRTREVAARVAQALGSSSSDEAYLARLRTGGYQLSDEAAVMAYPGPACVITGREDRVGGYVDQFDALKLYPNATYAVLAQAGHWVPFEQPAIFCSLVRDWLRRCRDSVNVRAL